MRLRWLGFLLLIFSLGVFAAVATGTTRVAPPAAAGWTVHEPIVYSNLALFPVSGGGALAGDYLTLDEGLRSGEVEVTELGAALIRRRPGIRPPQNPQVNTLALINHSKQPLLLLAGEIVTGGKQDRVIGKDRIVPPGAPPLPLDVFCVEPGRWHGGSLAFEGKGLMAAPRVREKAAVARNQQEVWAATGEVRRGVADAVGGAAPAELSRSSSYAQLEASPAFKDRIDAASARLQRDYERALRDALRGKNVIGVVVAINGEIVWADVFADADLFARYWPKLLRSYAVEALSAPVLEHAHASRGQAERFLAEQKGRQIIEVEPGEYRLVQIDHPHYNIFQLSSLWEKGEPLVHFAKLRKDGREADDSIRPMLRRR
jgi:hypothetical protein